MTAPSDPFLPGLSTALDVDLVMELLQRSLKVQGQEFDFLRGKIIDVKYKPRKQALLLYQFKLRHPGSKKTYKQMFSGCVYGRDSRPSTDVPDEVLKYFRGNESLLVRSPVNHEPESNIVFYTFPYDPVLPWLVEAADASATRDCLSQVWQPRKVKVRSVVVNVLGYTPQMRASFGYEVLAEHRATHMPELRRLIGKMHPFKRPEKLFANSWALWCGVRGKVGLAPPVGYSSTARLTFQESVTGVRLGGLVEARSFNRIVKTTARAIALLHSQRIPLNTTRKPRDEIRTFMRWTEVLASVRPGLRKRIERLSQRLAGELESRTEMTGPVHGDFHHTNVLVDNSRIWIIDLDEMAYGDPCVDIGRFLASLRIPSLRAFGAISGLSHAREIFLEEYLKKGPAPPRRIRLFEAASLMISAGSAFRIQRPNWEEEIGLLVGEAERVLESAKPGRASRIPREIKKAYGLSFEERIRWAGETTYMQATLDPFVQATWEARVTSCKISTPRKGGSGVWVEYQLAGQRHQKVWKARVRGLVLKKGESELLSTA